MLADDELRSFLARLLGWKNIPAIERALRSIEFGGIHRQLVLCGDDDLVPIAHALHRRILGADRPFVLGDPRRKTTPASVSAPANYTSGVAAFEAAAGGSLCIRSKRPPRDFASMMKLLRDPNARVQLVVCAGRYHQNDVLLVISDPIQVPPLKERAGELPRIVEEYAADARAALDSSVEFTSKDRDWIRARCASSLHEIETATLRVVALKQAGTVLNAAKLLGMGHTSLGEWFAHRRRYAPYAGAEETIPTRRFVRRAIAGASSRRAGRWPGVRSIRAS